MAERPNISLLQYNSNLITYGSIEDKDLNIKHVDTHSCIRSYPQIQLYTSYKILRQNDKVTVKVW